MSARTLYTIFVIAFATLAPLSANAQSKDKVTVFVNQKKPEIVAKFGVSEKTAEFYLRTMLSALSAREDANRDGTEVSRLYAETLHKYAQVVLLSEVVVARGQELLDEMKDGVPGTPVPQSLVEKINDWASFAGHVLVMSAEAGETAERWATQRVVQSDYCNSESEKHDFAKCDQILKETLSTIRGVIDHMATAVRTIGVMALTVPRMTF